MKLSIAWIFDHIDADWRKQDIETIVSKFNLITAEIEDYYTVQYDLRNFALGTLVKESGNSVTLNVPEWAQDYQLPKRPDLGEFKNAAYMVFQEGAKVRWAVCKNLNLDKEGYLPAFDVKAEDLEGDWKSLVESRDIILEIDNKSITHRPDMWGHRGFAREIAAFMKLGFISKHNFLQNHPVKQFSDATKTSIKNPFVVEKQAEGCNRFSGLYFPSIENKPTDLFTAFRLIKVGLRAINAVIDITNYVMLDWSQPTHVFDAGKISGKKIIARMAKKGEQLRLLDDREINLAKEDLVISDGEKPIALAGVMGGSEDSFSQSTKSIFLESANFDAATIRKTAFRHKSRTEASARFEKTLDPNQIEEAIMRFLSLAKKLGLKFEYADEIVAVGDKVVENVINVPHHYLETRAGFSLKEENIKNPLERIGFVVSPVEGKYDITIPSYRGTKDVEEKEDILEEVIRFYGFENIKPKMPIWEKQPANLNWVYKQRKIKKFLKNVARMTEQQNYNLYDEAFLKEIDYNPEKTTVNLLNPVSVDQYRLITSLIPGLMKNIKDNYALSDKHNFFEAGRTWTSINQKPIEQKLIAGIFFNKREKIDFYESKEYLSSLLEVFGINAAWKKSEAKDPWFNLHQTAEIVCGEKTIGWAGKVDMAFLSKIDVLPQSDAFLFEIDLDFILSFTPEVTQFKSLSKYQEVDFDLSFFVPLSITVSEIEKVLSNVDKTIDDVKMIDYFERDEWSDKRSLAFRVKLVNPDKTFDKDEIEMIRQKAIKSLTKLGAELRA
ncbi:phenylalanine--tRNA ligase subunit beta [Candidatus Babeliales bacterium]|nr:phenylalanine--tRNA ligase subunit beta [Candidatus Babeliales bacterium]